MRIEKDGRVWSAYDKDLDICISGDTRAEAAANLNKAITLLKNTGTMRRLKKKIAA